MSDKQSSATSNPRNILIIITDQERAVSEWPESYRSTLEKQLPAMNALKQKGLSFNHAYTASCMCSPSRATFQTSQYPIVTGCTTTGSSVLPSPAGFPNLATVLSAAGYSCYWIGKWHLFGPQEPGSGAADLLSWGYQAYGVAGDLVAWDPPDAGWTLGTTYLGGGTKDNGLYCQNDQRYVADAINFLQNAPTQPWCLVVSLVNPHDVHLGYEGLAHHYYDLSTYGTFKVDLPADRHESLEKMPRGQSVYAWEAVKGTGARMEHFADLYAYLMTYVDGQIATILDTLTAQSLTDDTLIIRFSDHGEMGLSHGLVEKFVNAYSQVMHVPLVFSYPKMWDSPVTTDALASTADLVPTLASWLGVSNPSWHFVGTDLMPVINEPSTSVQDFVHFTYDDLGDRSVPSVIRAIRSKEWLYAVYLDCVDCETSGFSDADWEMYDLTKDFRERTNVAGMGLLEQSALDWLLQMQMVQKRTAPAWYPGNWPPQATVNSRGGPPPATDQFAGCAIADLPGVSAEQANALIYIGVRDSAALLACTATPQGRQALAGAVAVDAATLGQWIENAKRFFDGRDKLVLGQR